MTHLTPPANNGLPPPSPPPPILIISSAFAVRGLAGGDNGKVSPFTPKAAALQYWSQKVPDGQARPPEFLVSKLSPLTVQNTEELQRLADGNALSTKLSAFCSWANLCCLPDVTAGQEKHADPRLIRQVTDPSNKNHPDVPYYYGRVEKNHPDVPYYYGRENHLIRQLFYGEIAGAHAGHSLSVVELMHDMYFRESQLQEGKLVKMPDIKDKMPAHSFLPRSIAGMLPFTYAALPELLQVFKADDNSTFAYIMGKTLWECQRAPSKGETNRCVTSAEDMIDFAVDVVGPSATAKTTAGLGGSNATVQIGRVVKINGGHVTKGVSCHQKAFPYLVYSCHSVPNVRVYEVDLLHQSTKAPLNRAIAICHVDTSAWWSHHISFRVLGGGPGKIEVCHWVFQNDIAWVGHIN